jgi:hypothetical protein
MGVTPNIDLPDSANTQGGRLHWGVAPATPDCKLASHGYAALKGKFG